MELELNWRSGWRLATCGASLPTRAKLALSRVDLYSYLMNSIQGHEDAASNFSQHVTRHKSSREKMARGAVSERRDEGPEARVLLPSRVFQEGACAEHNRQPYTLEGH
ncbi:hypothetical protein Dda_7073 [Drechslerella dactyloides]|uniref:Uncharacterized protein n=1 Tax=Drechslerella dactyloides TaxID=74499 RepID=A0AAD6ITM0_DREDA|nr:hypothetical protein Dda_7073 [Drechslerella dactyloides]